MVQTAILERAADIHDLFVEFVEGDAVDPTGTIRLADDRWDLCAYQSKATGNRVLSVSFFGLGVVAPYAKWYVLDRILTAGRAATSTAGFISALRPAAATMARSGITSIDDLVAPDVFRMIWEGLADLWTGAPGERPRSSVWRQAITRPFWVALQRRIGVPGLVPPTFTFAQPTIAEIARRDDQVIPPAVIRQLGNRLALHRDQRESLSNRDLVRLCVLMLHIALGRRISEILLAPRSAGPRGPLVDYSTTTSGVALGFRFSPNKDGVDNLVYVSEEWRDLVEFCVATLISLGDEVRPFVQPRDVGLLILVGGSNATKTWGRPRPGPRARPKRASDYAPSTGLTYASFLSWLNGGTANVPVERGALTRWAITASGTPGGAIYYLRTHGARHTRQSVLAGDSTISRLAAQRDLNTASVEVQSVYQHGLAAQNAELRRRAGAGELIARGAAWVAEIEGAGYAPGEPMLLKERPRVLRLLAANPALIEFNRVPTGYCVRPQGPAACPEFMQCAEATESGCAWFATDPADERCVIEVNERAVARRLEASAAEQAGRVVLAGKLAKLAERAEQMRDQTLAAAPSDILAKMRSRLAADEP